jgi:hypothetical protein
VAKSVTKNESYYSQPRGAAIRMQRSPVSKNLKISNLQSVHYKNLTIKQEFEGL